MLSRFAIKALGFISTIIIARLLGADGRGLVSALLVPSQIAVSVSELGLRQSAAHHIGRGAFPLAKVQSTLLAMAPLTALVAAAGTILYFHIAHVAVDSWPLRAAAISLIPLGLISSYATGIFLGRQRIAEFRSASWRPAVLSFLLLLGLGFGLKLGVWSAILASVGGSVVGALYALWLLSREEKLSLRFHRDVAVSLQRRGLGFAVSMASLTLNYRLMTLLMIQSGSMGQLGIYVQAVSIAELIWEVPTALSALLLSKGVNAQDAHAFSAKVMALTRVAVLAAIGVSLGLAIVAPFGFPLVFGAAFAASAPVCLVLLPGIVAFVATKILSVDLASRNKPLTTLIAVGPSLLLSIVLGPALIRQYGATGAAVATSTSYVVGSAIYLIVYSRVVKTSVINVIRPRASDWALVRQALKRKS